MFDFQYWTCNFYGSNQNFKYLPNVNILRSSINQRPLLILLKLFEIITHCEIKVSGITLSDLWKWDFRQIQFEVDDYQVCCAKGTLAWYQVVRFTNHDEYNNV